MNSTTYHQKSGKNNASVESLEAKISTLDMLRVSMASECSFPPTAFYKAKDVAPTDGDADSIKGNGTGKHELHITTKKVNPVSCASGHALISNGFEVDLTKSTTAADTREGSGMVIQSMRIPTKSENCEPGPTLNPASCASGLALIGGGIGDGWISDLSMTAPMETISNHQGNTNRRNSSSQSNEDWEDLRYP